VNYDFVFKHINIVGQGLNNWLWPPV